jgi:circadian clock protein KaiB
VDAYHPKEQTMPKRKTTYATEQYEAAHALPSDQIYVLRLYIAGTTPRSTQAIVNIKQICEQHLLGRYELEVIDIYQQPMLAVDEQIIAAPTLIKQLPFPLRKFIGDLSDTERILIGLDLRMRSAPKDT